MEMEMEVLKKGKAIVVKELDALFNKGTLSPSETEAATKGLCLLEKIDKYMKGETDFEDEGYSERRSRRSYGNYDGNRPYREYDIVAYENRGGQSNSMRSMNSMDGMYYDNRGSNRQGSYDNQPRDMRGRYSGHSINDRVVDKLEHLMDSAESDYEKKKLHEFIRFVRDDEMKE